MAEYKVKGKRITIHSNGQIFVDGKSTGLKQWKNGTQYSNLSGQVQEKLNGMSLEDMLIFKGFLAR